MTRRTCPAPTLSIARLQEPQNVTSIFFIFERGTRRLRGIDLEFFAPAEVCINDLAILELYHSDSVDSSLQLLRTRC